MLYRMNAQSNTLEYAFKRNGVPYKIIGGTKFFDRAEVKDMLAYLCVINNPADDLRLRRIVNVPARKIGAATMDKAQAIATEESMPLMEVLRRAGGYPQLKASAGKLTSFTEMIDEMRRQAGDMSWWSSEICVPPQRLCGAPGEERCGEPGAPGKRGGAQLQHPGLPWKTIRESHIVGLPGRGWPCIRTWTARRQGTTA